VNLVDLEIIIEPVIGVLFTALEAAGSLVDGALLDKPIPTILNPALFSTTIDYSIGSSLKLGFKFL
jgi:hypothetical protein